MVFDFWKTYGSILWSETSDLGLKDKIRTQEKMTKMTYVTKRMSPTQTVAKKHLKLHLRRIRNKEYCRLRDMVPAIAQKQHVSKVTVIEEAVRYIDELHRALASRLTNKDMTSCHDDKDAIKNLVHSMIPADFYERKLPITTFEKQQNLPTYMAHNRVKKPARFS